MGGRWANWRDGKLSTRRRALRRYVLWPCCKPRWRAERHVADRQGQVPAEAAAWGWQRPKTGRKWVSQGTRIGWVAGNDLYLDPLASYQTAQALAGAERIPVSEQALRHQLRKCGFLAGLDTGRGHAHRLGGGERLIPGSAGELPDGPGAGWGGTHTGERAGAPPPATEVRLLGQPGHRPRARASVGWRGTTYTWIRWRVTRRPRRWLGRNA